MSAGEYCHRHSDQTAAWFCHRCERWLCADCVRHILGRDEMLHTTCRQCGGDLTRLDPAVVVGLPIFRFFPHLHEAFRIPLHRENLPMLLAAILAAWLGAMWFALPFLGYVMPVLFGFYFNGYLLHVIQHIGCGQDDLPDWLDVTDPWDSLLYPLALSLGVVAVGLGPLGLTYVLNGAWEALLAAGIWAIVYLPMALAAVGWSDALEALNPLLVLRSILRIPVQYMATLVLLIVLVLLYSPLGHVLQTLPVVGPLVLLALTVYLIFVEVCMLGLLVQANRKRLGWKS